MNCTGLKCKNEWFNLNLIKPGREKKRKIGTTLCYQNVAVVFLRASERRQNKAERSQGKRPKRIPPTTQMNTTHMQVLRHMFYLTKIE